MKNQRRFKATDYMQPSAGDPIRSVVFESQHSVIVAWMVQPGQSIAPHRHPAGQDTWTILSGHGRYQTHEDGSSIDISPGDIVVALQNQVHGVTCVGEEALQFVSVVAPTDAGYEPLKT